MMESSMAEKFAMLGSVNEAAVSSPGTRNGCWIPACL